jgi:isopentenyl-diphosphate delta-isomerase
VYIIRKQRKTEHLHLAVQTVDGPDQNGFEDIALIPDAVPELNLDDIDLSNRFLGKYLACPIIINALTGGTEEAKTINRQLARLVGKYGLAMAVGSQTIALEDHRLIDSFTVVREINPQGLLIANVSANSPVAEALAAVKMIAADGLQLHFNIPQELAMHEGDRHFRGILDNVRGIVDQCPVPVIAKEVGFGFSRESVSKLHAGGVNIFDCGGKGGTNFLAIEDQRGGMFDQSFYDWGIPTAVSLAEIVDLQLPIQVVASGGIRSASDLAKAIAMGADLVGITGLFLKILLNEGYEELDRQIARLLYQSQAVFLMTGSKNCAAIRQKPLLIFNRTAEWLRLRAVDPTQWSRK